MEGEGKGQRNEGREYRRPQRRCGEPERGLPATPAPLQGAGEAARHPGTARSRGHGEPPRRRARDEGRRAWAPARHCSLQQGAGEAARCPGASGPEGRRARAPLQGAGIWARASGARRLGAQRGRLGRTDEVAAARVREVNRTFFMGRCIFPLWAGPRYGERHTSPHWASATDLTYAYLRESFPNFRFLICSKMQLVSYTLPVDLFVQGILRCSVYEVSNSEELA